MDRVADRLSETQAGIKLHTVMRHTELSILMGPFVRRLTVSSFDGFLACTAFLEECEEAIKKGDCRSDRSRHGEGLPYESGNGHPDANRP